MMVTCHRHDGADLAPVPVLRAPPWDRAARTGDPRAGSPAPAVSAANTTTSRRWQHGRPPPPWILE